MRELVVKFADTGNSEVWCRNDPVGRLATLTCGAAGQRGRKLKVLNHGRDCASTYDTDRTHAIANNNADRSSILR